MLSKLKWTSVRALASCADSFPAVQRSGTNTLKLSTTLAFQPASETKWTINTGIWLKGCCIVGGLIAQQGWNEAHMEAASKQTENQRAAELISNEHTAKFTVFTQRAVDSWRKGRQREAEQFMIHALEEAKLGFGERSSHVAAALQHLGEIYRNQNKLEVAEPYYREAVEILRERNGENDHIYGGALASMALLFAMKKETVKARDAYRNGLKAVQISKGKENGWYAKILAEYACFEIRNDNRKQGYVLLEEAVRMYEQLGPSTTTEYLRAVISLAMQTLDINQVTNTEKQKAFEILHKAISRVESFDHLERSSLEQLGWMQNMVADLLLDQGKLALALDSYHVALSTQELSRSSEVNGSQLVGIARLELQVNPGDQNALIRAYNLAKQALSYFPAFQDQAESVSKEPSSFEKWFKSLVGTVSGMPWDEMLATKEVREMSLTEASGGFEALSILAKTHKGLGRHEEAMYTLRQSLRLLRHAKVLKVQNHHNTVHSRPDPSRDQEILSIEDARLCQLLITQITLYLEFNEGKLDEASEPALQFLDRKMDAVYNRYLSDKNVPFEASLEHRISAYQIVLADYLPKSHGHIRFRLPKRQD